MEFKVNEYITLKLEQNNSVIYLKHERFMQCTRLVAELD